MFQPGVRVSSFCILCSQAVSILQTILGLLCNLSCKVHVGLATSPPSQGSAHHHRPKLLLPLLQAALSCGGSDSTIGRPTRAGAGVVANAWCIFIRSHNREARRCVAPNPTFPPTTAIVWCFDSWKYPASKAPSWQIICASMSSVTGGGLWTSRHLRPGGGLNPRIHGRIMAWAEAAIKSMTDRRQTKFVDPCLSQ